MLIIDCTSLLNAYTHMLWPDLPVGGGFGAGAGGRVKGLDGTESGWVGSGGGGVVFSTHLHTQEGAQEDYTYYFPEVGEKVKKFYTRCHALCAKGDTVLEATGAAAEAAAAAAFVGGTGSAGATCQVRYPHALGQLNNNGASVCLRFRRRALSLCARWCW
jgi:hypothetical protein